MVEKQKKREERDKRRINKQRERERERDRERDRQGTNRRNLIDKSQELKKKDWGLEIKQTA